MKKVIVTKLSRAIRHVVSRGAQGPRGGLWAGWADIPDKPDFDALYDPLGAASTAQSAAAADATAKVNAHASAPDPHPQYALDTDLSGHAGNTSNPHSVTKAQIGLGNVDNTSDASKPVSTAQQNALNAKEPTIAAGTSAQYWRGDKSWADFAASVRAVALTALSTASAAVVTATDSVLVAIGKLQAQISDVITQTEAETGTSTTRRSWTSQRVRQATAAWWLTASSAFGRTLIGVANEAAGRTALGLGSASVLAAGQADAALPTNLDIRAYYGSKFNPGVLPTFEMDFGNAQFSLYDAGDSGVYRTSRHFDEFAAWFGTDMQITRASTQTYFDALGNMREAPVNTVRCDHDPLTGRKLGGYVGGSRTNLCKYSAGRTQRTVMEASLDAETWTAPDGTAAGIWTASAAASSHRLSRTVNAATVGTSLVSYGWYIYVPPGSDVRRLYLRGRASSGQAVVISITGNGATTQMDFLQASPFGTYPPAPATASSVTIQKVTNTGVFRVSVTSALSTDAAALSTAMDISWSAGTTEDTAGTANTRLGVWGWQYEVGGSPSPYIPVPGDASVVRAATTIMVSGTKLAGLFGFTEATLVARAITSDTAITTDRRIFLLSDGTVNNRLSLHINGASVRTFANAGGTYLYGPAVGTAVGTTPFTVAMSGRSGLYSAACKGVAAADGAVTGFGTFDRLQIGYGVTSQQFEGYIQAAALYPRALSSSQITELSK